MRAICLQNMARAPDADLEGDAPMPLFRRGRSTSEAERPRAPHAGKDSPALQAILARLDDELWRARRYARPLSAITAVPELLRGEHVEDELMAAVLETARRTLRRSDGVELVEGPLLIAVMPETGRDEAQAAAYRLGAALQLPGLASRQLKWRTSSATLTDEEAAASLLDAALAMLADAA
jgi:hypothetical protein